MYIKIVDLSSISTNFCQKSSLLYCYHYIESIKYIVTCRVTYDHIEYGDQ